VAVPSLWRDGDFMRLWAGQTVSQFGEQVTQIALPLTAVLLLHASPFQMGVLGAMTTLPFVLVGLFVGVFVDRRRRRPLLIAADMGRAILLGLVFVLGLLHRLSLLDLGTIAFGVGCLTVLFDVAYQSYLPSLVGRAAIVEGNAKMEATRALSQVAGPSVGGVLVQVLTAPLAVGANALTYVVSVVSLLAIGRAEPTPQRLTGSPGAIAQIREGLVWVLSNPILRAIAGCTGTSNFFGNVAFAVFVLFAVHDVGLSPALLGLVYAAGSVGGVAGALVAPRIGRRLGIGPTIVASAALFVLCPLAIPLAPRDLGIALPLLIGAYAFQSLGSTTYNIAQVSLRQAITPDALLGRMNASIRFVVWGTIPFGSFVGGLLGTAVGLRPTLWIAAVGGLLSVAWVVASPVLRVQTVDRAAQAATAG
jgi:MFS family permease